MKKLVYLSSYSFVDTDLPIIRELNKFFELNYIVIFYWRADEYMYTPQQVTDFCHENRIQCKTVIHQHQARNPRGIFKDYQTAREIKQYAPDVIYYAISGMYLPLLMRLFCGAHNTIIAIHDVVLHKGSHIFKSLFRKLIFRRYDQIHVFSRNQRDLLKKVFPDKAIYFAPLALKDFGRTVGVYREPASLQQRRFLFFGMVRYNKGLDILIKAANRLAYKYRDFKIAVAGSCQDFSMYHKLIEKPDYFDLDIRVIPNDEVPNIFAQTDFLILPYRDVTQSGVLLTAYNYNVPAIASDFAGFREYIQDGELGFLFEPENVDDLYDCLDKAMQMSREQIYQMKNKVADFVAEEISLESIIARYLAFINAVSHREKIPN